jgi:Protein of unknown function (DUF2795)
MDGSTQGSDRHSQWLDDALARDPGVEEETPEAQLWDMPWHDGVVEDADSDLDRVDLRSEIGRYVSLVPFPTDAKTLIAGVERMGAPDNVLEELRAIDPGERFANPAELWAALGLSSHRPT